jgi:hypothetical protein
MLALMFIDGKLVVLVAVPRERLCVTSAGRGQSGNEDADHHHAAMTLRGDFNSAVVQYSEQVEPIPGAQYLGNLLHCSTTLVTNSLLLHLS